MKQESSSRNNEKIESLRQQAEDYGFKNIEELKNTKEQEDNLGEYWLSETPESMKELEGFIKPCVKDILARIIEDEYGYTQYNSEEIEDIISRIPAWLQRGVIRELISVGESWIVDRHIKSFTSISEDEYADIVKFICSKNDGYVSAARNILGSISADKSWGAVKVLAALDFYKLFETEEWLRNLDVEKQKELLSIVVMKSDSWRIVLRCLTFCPAINNEEFVVNILLRNMEQWSDLTGYSQEFKKYIETLSPVLHKRIASKMLEVDKYYELIENIEAFTGLDSDDRKKILDRVTEEQVWCLGMNLYKFKDMSSESFLEIAKQMIKQRNESTLRDNITIWDRFARERNFSFNAEIRGLLSDKRILFTNPTLCGTEITKGLILSLKDNEKKTLIEHIKENAPLFDRESLEELNTKRPQIVSENLHLFSKISPEEQREIIESLMLQGHFEFVKNIDKLKGVPSTDHQMIVDKIIEKASSFLNPTTLIPEALDKLTGIPEKNHNEIAERMIKGSPSSASAIGWNIKKFKNLEKSVLKKLSWSLLFATQTV